MESCIYQILLPFGKAATTQSSHITCSNIEIAQFYRNLKVCTSRALQRTGCTNPRPLRSKISFVIRIYQLMSVVVRIMEPEKWWDRLSGAAARIQEINKKVLYVHCNSHLLNLSVATIKEICPHQVICTSDQCLQN